MLSFSPRDVLDETLDLIESVSEGFPTYSLNQFKQPYRQCPLFTGLRTRYDARCSHLFSSNGQRNTVVSPYHLLGPIYYLP